jgi:8-oxo-dGTP pyrophosphatase MutT (NUDIX family)
MTIRQPTPCDDGELVQCAALPFRMSGGLMVLLQTSRDTGRWVLPKGWLMKKEKPYSAARREALEEAGVIGQIAKRSIGAFHYEKRLTGGATVICEVHVYALAVQGQRKRWPERRMRTQRWFTPHEAAEVVEEPELSALLRGLTATNLKKPPRERRVGASRLDPSPPCGHAGPGPASQP